MNDLRERGPVVQQELLIQHLVALRHDRELTQEQVGRHLSWSVAKMKRFEGGVQTLPPRMLNTLLECYGVSDKPLGQELRHLGEGARQRAWWSKTEYRSVMTPAYRKFVGLEAGADRILHIQTTVIPGLLQTKEYAEWVTSEWELPNMVEPLLKVRMHRQSTIDIRVSPPRQVYLLDENVLRKPVGPPGLMSRQLHHLVKLTQESNVDIRVIPDEVGMHFGMQAGSFILLEFDSGLNRVLCKEQANSCLLSNGKDETMRYRAKFEETMGRFTLGVDESSKMMHSYAVQHE